ncbi:MAG: divalent cation tolerance protein CutA [Lentisphaerae bacterium]|nr:divalent cation tolerance protein CutA [Lentisphaerota bacterium]
MRGHPVTGTRLYAGEALPVPAAFDWLVMMGGPMGVHDEATCPWLHDEKRLLRDAIAAGRAVLGICLGAQLLADALGARVYANAHKEIGWFPVQRTPTSAGALAGFPDSLDVLHWHGDTFDLPPGANHLLASEACTHQAFVAHHRLYGLQFHMEIEPHGCRALIEHGRHELVPGPYIQHADELLADPTRFFTAATILERVLDAMAADDAVVIISTALETAEQADRMATALVEQRLAACVQILPARSTYRWEGRLQKSGEHVMLIKTRAACAPAAMDFLKTHHPYALPEILVTPVQDGLPDYRQWIASETAPPPATTT